MRTKAQLIAILAKKHEKKMFENSKWIDLKQAISAETAPQKAKLMSILINGNSGRVGQFMRNILIKDVQGRALIKATDTLADSSLDLVELDDLL